MSYTTGCSDSQSYHISFPATPGTSPDKADNDILHQIHWRYATESHPDAFRTFLPACGRSLPLFLCIPVRYNSDYVFHRTDSSPLFIHTQYFRVLIRKPFRSCTGRCGQNCRNSLCVKWINHFFEPVKLIISSYPASPREHSYRYRIDLCLFKILNVLFQYIRAVQPLLRVVVSAM